MDALSIVHDEVALEGLDGITIPSLWIRLGSRTPSFPLKLDSYTKEFIWRSLINNVDLDFYELPKERVDVELLDRFADINPDTGIQTTTSFSNAKNDVYPVTVVLDDKDGIQGSCLFYKQRKNVTKNVRTEELKQLVCLEEAVKRYGRKLVVVASQKMRFRVLIGEDSDPDLRITDQSYCILERLGRARWQGELQRDLHSSFRTEPGKLHYLRRCLDRHGLITMQSHVIRLPTGQQQHSILLLIKRYHVLRRSKYDILMEHLSNTLQDAPGQIASIITLRELLNVHERTFKHVYNYMLSYKLVQLITLPLEDLNPSAGPCNTKKGTKITVRCLKLLKPYQKKELMVEEDDDENEDGVGVSRKGLPQQDIIMERDLVLQAYHIVVSSGTKGISQSSLQVVMNVGKLEARMLCRRLERDGMIKGFMVDVGRQRTTKFIGHMSVSASDHMQQFVKERERNQLLCNSEPLPEENPGTPSSAPKALPTCKASSTPRPKTTKGTPKAKAKDIQRGDPDFVAKGKKRSVGGRGKKTPVPEQQALAALITPIKRETPETSVSEPSVVETPCAAESSQEEEGDPVLSPIVGLDEREALDSASDDAQKSIKVVEDMPKRKKQGIRLERSHETYRLLKRKNMIVEVVRSVKIVEGLYALQKMINDNEKLDGSSTKCCKKSILRLIRLLSKEGLVKMFRTTVIQDGVSKKVEFVVHPSVQPNDNMVKSAIEQVRFRISGSYAVARVQQEQAKQGMELSNTSPHTPKSKKNKEDKKTSPEAQDAFMPTTVRGLSRTLGFQPKMHRLRLVHTFLWYVVYGPYQKGSTGTDSPKPSQPADDNTTSSSSSSSSSSHSSSSKVISAPAPENGQNCESLNPSDCENTNGAENAATAVASTPQKSGETALRGDEVSVQMLKQRSLESNAKVFADELSWKRYLPPLRVHKEFGYGWALVSDVVLCLPLSIFVQVTQINFKIEGLDEYLNDPVKQHYLVRVLPAQIKRQLLYKRKYIFAFYENLQKLVYMGLLQFGPMEKFQDKDQVFIFIRQHATIVDTTSAEPHYWQVTENPDKPFERRQYQFSTAADVENYWFDLLCVCLNTPLGLVRGKRGAEKEITMPSLVLPDRSRFLKLAYLLKGRRDELDDGSTPGDGRGAGGLDSEFFAHLKRNWLWTNYLLACKKNLCDGELINSKMRLKSLLSKNALRLALKAGESTAPRGMTTKRAKVMEFAEVGVEPAGRNQQVIGGKRQKRKRTRKEVVKVPRKKRKEAKTRVPAHDEADHRALKMMTRQRVFWSLQEDSMLMLCGVAAKLLNDKLTRPFVPYCVVRDMLQAELENSMDKTSLAVGRRTRYILKNPQTLLNHRICLAEVYQDKALMDELELKKPADPNKLEDCAQAFSEYTRLLRHKFSSSTISCDVTLPETKSLLFSRYKVFTIDHEQQRTFKDDLTCTEDIHAIVLHNLIQSTLVMSNSQMKSSRSFQTFHMYSLFNQEVLCQVFIQCRKRGLVNRRRVHKAYGPKKNRALPILPMSYQLSQTYYKCFTWRFPTSLCTDAFRFLRALRDNGTGDAHKITSFYNEAESRMDVPPAPSGPGTTEGSPVESAGTKDQGEGGSGGLKGTDGASGDLRGTDGDSGGLKGTDGASGDLKGTDGASGDLKGTDGASGDLKGTDGASGDLKGTDGASGDLKGTDGASGDLKGTDGASGDLKGTDGASGDLKGTGGDTGDLKRTGGDSGDLKRTGGDTGDLKRTGGDTGDLKRTGGDTGDLKRTGGDTGDLKRTGGDSGDLKRTGGDTGDLKGTGGDTGDLKGTGGDSGDLKRTGGDTGDLKGTGGDTGDLKGTGGDTGDLKGTGGDTGDLKGTGGDLGDLKGTGGDLKGTDGDLKGTGGDTGDLKRTDGDSGDLKVPVEEPVSEAMIQADGPDTVSPAEPGESNQSKQGEEPVEMEEGNGEGEVPGVEGKPQTQRSTAQDSFVVNAGGLVPAPRSAESPSAQEEQPGAGPVVGGPGPSLEHHQDLSDMMHLSLDSPGGMCAAALTLMSLGLLSVHVSIPKEVVLVDNTVVKTDVVKRLTALEEEDEEDDADDSEGKKRLPGKATVSHTSYLMMKGYCYPGIVQLRNLSTCDNIVVDPCTLRFKLRDTPAHQIFSAQDSPPLDLTRCGPSLVPAILSRSLRLPSRSSSSSSSSAAGQGWAAPLKAYWGFSQQDAEACGALRASLDRAGEGGLGEEQLHRDLAHLEQPLEGRTRGLQQYMQVLEEECQAVRVGAQGVRWVLAEHARPWLLTVRLRPGLSQGYTKGRLRPRWQTRHSIPFMRKRAPEVAATMVMRMEEEEEDEEEEDAEPPRKRGRGGNGSAMEDGLVAEEKEEEEEVGPSVEDGKTRKGGEEGEVRENGLEKECEGSDNEEVLSPPPSTAPSGGGDEEMSYISRPWRMVDGSINRLACKGMLEGLLYHVMARPGITQHCLVEHYQNTLQPMAVLDLIQALIDMGCVRRKSVVSRKATLFSRHADPPTEPAAATSGPGATDTWFYEPTISCVLRLAQVLPNEPHWNQYV